MKNKIKEMFNNQERFIDVELTKEKDLYTLSFYDKKKKDKTYITAYDLFKIYNICYLLTKKQKEKELEEILKNMEVF